MPYNEELKKIVARKLEDAENFARPIAMHADEAEVAGAFEEDALDYETALESILDIKLEDYEHGKPIIGNDPNRILDVPTLPVSRQKYKNR